MISRRDFIGISALIGAGTLTGFTDSLLSGKGHIRRFSLCTNPGILNSNPGFFNTILKSGITDIWFPFFLNGYMAFPEEDHLLWKKRFNKEGIPVQVINVPLGHPENSLGGEPGLDTPPLHWPRGVDIDGNKFSGTSVHPIVTRENVDAIRKIGNAGFTKLFLDDDFRLARSPGMIGGCFCDEHRDEFLRKYGYKEPDWMYLKQDISDRQLSSLLRNWIDFNCDQLTASFRTQQLADQRVEPGIMVMYMGAEKAGIRLSDYKGSMMRVGELMFDDKSFSRIKGKTDELFSALFHRRYVDPEIAYSETTAWPPKKLSATNMAAKLHISTIADIRNTTLMSGLEPFPFTHWEVLTPAMKKVAEMHKKVAGHKPRGPFKHFWGEAGRMVSKDQPYSLFLATGIPFEVTDLPADEGWTFLCEPDARDVAMNKLKSAGTQFIYAPKDGKKLPELRMVGENLDELYSFKHQIISQLRGIPYVKEDKPVVCAWYPEIKTVLLWNLSETKEGITIILDNQKRTIEIGGLDADLIHIG